MKVNTRCQFIHGALLAGVVMTAWGCQAPLAEGERPLPQPAVYEHQPRSIVFDTPKIRQLAQARHSQTGSSLPPADVPWYSSRNTVRLTTDAGYQTATTDQTITTTFDRQSITAGGQARDHYHSTTYRRSTTQTVR